MIWSENEVEQFTLELANTDISSLLDEIQVMEDAVAEAALFPEFRGHFRQAFEVINEAASYWLEEGCYSTQARRVIHETFSRRDLIYERLCYAQSFSLPDVVREVLGRVDAIPGSRMAASYAFAQALDAVQRLADWLVNVELDVYGINPDLAEWLRLNDSEFFQTLVERQRRTQPDREADVRETFAQWVGESEKVLMLADLYRQSEVALSSGKLQPGSFFPKMIDKIYTVKSSERARLAGRGNSRQGTATQDGKEKKRELTRAAVERIKKSYPDIEPKALLSRLVGIEGIGTRDTIRENLRELGEYGPRKKRKTSGPC
ncbi:hypothetical protein JYG36_04915 [Pseudomonas sp. SORT22]|uniref:hypothetical protein n=1 Tax=Pseudomonas sp. SORT22 TaxID=2813842 RepID=UPI001BCB9EBD|nr:hypothetical protein [Pseudomonas sp. SORT22]QVM97532.1 hypothetical protein JYG36_04915 [Pseudomonas sp. SORT22]